jgi:hypothetical protein
MLDPSFKVDPAKIDAAIAEREAEAVTLEIVAESLETLADDKRREASRLRGQNVALLKTAREHGYPGSPDSGSDQ